MEPLTTFFDEARGDDLPLPDEFAALYGPLRLPRHADRAHVITNFVTSLDGIVVVDPPRGQGADLSGGDAHDRAVMGLLRAVADAVVVGGGNLRAEGDHVWTAARVSPELAAPASALRAALGKPPAPLQVVVSGKGDVDPARAVFGGEAPSLVVTTPEGEARLRARSGTIRVAAVPTADGWLSLGRVLHAAGLGPGAIVLCESGPTSTTRYLAHDEIDELFVTRAPLLVGRGGAPPTLGLVEGEVFRPGTRPARLVSARRHESFLFLRYSL